MGGVNGDEPPSKRRKSKPLSSSSSSSSSSQIISKPSVLDSSMAESLPDDDSISIGSKGVKKVEFVRLIAESLNSLGYKKSSEFLEIESGITLTSSVVTEFTQHILNRNWDESLNSLRKITTLDDSIVKSCSFVILQQKFLELLDLHNVDDALTTLRKQISPLSIYQNRVHELSLLVFSLGQHSVKPKSEFEILHDLQKLFPPNVMIPEGRLLQLIEQALDLQRETCSFHNSLNQNTSLFINHNCGKNKIPSRTLQTLQEHRDEIWYVSFSHNGKFLASSSKDKSAIIWKVNPDGQLKFHKKLLGHKEPVSCVSWSPNDDFILTCGVEENVRRWDVLTGECVLIYDKTDLGMISCNWSPDGKTIFTGFNNKSIVTWDLNGTELETFRGEKTLRISDLQVTNDGKYILSICKETMILILDRESGEERLIKEDYNISSFSLSGDNKFLLVSLVNQEIHLWGGIYGNLRLVAKYKGRKCSRFVVRACFGGIEDKFVASGSEDSKVYIWHRETGEVIESLSGHSGAVNCTSWNPVNPHMLASASDDRTVRIWGLNHGNLEVEC